MTTLAHATEPTLSEPPVTKLPLTQLPLTEIQARDEICRVGRSLFERGYVHGTAGNVSVQLAAEAGGGFLITPTDACLGFLEPARLARVDALGVQLSGDAASKTLALHRRIYAATALTAASAGCVIHTHSSHCVQLSLATEALAGQSLSAPLGAELLAALTPYFVMKVGRVPHLAYTRPGAVAAVDAAAAAIARYHTAGTPLRAVMLARLGPTVWHDSPERAMAVLEELEETARLALACPAAAPLSEEQIEELRVVFGVSW
jgi:3-dehydro-4-phosphotetronate decarboxylase